METMKIQVMIDLDTICPQKGVGTLRFGSKKQALVELLGHAFVETQDEYGDVEIVYPQAKMRFWYWSDFDFRLGCIESERLTSKLLGTRLIGLDKPAVKRFINDRIKSGITEEDGCEYDDGETLDWIDADDKSLFFWFRNGKLYQIGWTCAWSDGNTPIWP